jgi:hypothetical protein
MTDEEDESRERLMEGMRERVESYDWDKALQKYLEDK